MSKSSSRPPEPPGPSFLELVRAYRQFILRIAEKEEVLRADAEDVTQLVLHALWQEVRKHGLPEHPRAWLATVTRRIAVNYHHGRLGWRLDRPDTGELSPDELGPSSEQLCLAREQVELVGQLLASLRPERAELLRRYELEGEPLIAIAREQGVPPGTVYTRLRLAREDLKAAYERWLERNEGAKASKSKEDEKKRKNRKKRRRGVLLPFAFLGEHVAIAPANPPSRSPRRTAAFQAPAALLFVLLATLDTPLRRCGVEIDTAARVQSAALTPALVKGPFREAAPTPGVLGAPWGSPDSPSRGSVATSARSSSGSSPGNSIPPSQRSSPAPAAHPSNPPLPGDLETARIHLHLAARMAAENKPEIANQALHGYEVRVPDNPLPATKAALESSVRPPSPGTPTGIVPQ